MSSNISFNSNVFSNHNAFSNNSISSNNTTLLNNQPPQDNSSSRKISEIVDTFLWVPPKFLIKQLSDHKCEQFLVSSKLKGSDEDFIANDKSPESTYDEENTCEDFISNNNPQGTNKSLSSQENGDSFLLDENYLDSEETFTPKSQESMSEESMSEENTCEDFLNNIPHLITKNLHLLNNTKAFVNNNTNHNTTNNAPVSATVTNLPSQVNNNPPSVTVTNLPPQANNHSSSATKSFSFSEEDSDTVTKEYSCSSDIDRTLDDSDTVTKEFSMEEELEEEVSSQSSYTSTMSNVAQIGQNSLSMNYSEESSGPDIRFIFESSSEQKSSSDSLDYTQPVHKKGLKVSRTVVAASQNFTPTTIQDDDINIDELIKDHANLRVSLMYLRLLAIHNLGVRSSGDLSKIDVTVNHANYQYGKGSKEKKTHAAHACAAAGTTDNLRELIEKQTTKEHKLTPKKILLLASKGFPTKAVEKLKNPSTTGNEIRNIYATYWPKTHLHESVLSGTLLERTLNSTNELDQELNLICDKSLEAEIRPKVAKLIKKVMLGQLSPEDGTRKYHKKIIKHFDSVIELVEDKIKNIKNYIKDLTLIKSLKTTTPIRDLTEVLTRMSESQKCLNEVHEGVSKTVLQANQKFLKDGIKKLKQLKGTSTTHKFHQWVANKYEPMKKEAEVKLAKIQRILKYNLLEKEGTILPPFHLYLNKYNSAADHFSPLSSPQRTKRQYKLLEKAPVKKQLFKNSVAKKH